jgi:hypothetical protein
MTNSPDVKVEAHRHAWHTDKTQIGSVCYDCGVTQHDWFFDEHRRLTAELKQARQELAAIDEVGTLEHARRHVGCGEIIQARDAALTRAREDLDRTRAELDQARAAGRILEASVLKLRADNQALRRVVARVLEWDHLDAAADGPFWRAQLSAALGQERVDA